MADATKLRILIGEDHPLVAAGLAKLLDNQFEIVGTENNGRALVGAALERRPDIVALDISMPELNGIEAARQIRAELPETKLIFVTVHTDLVYVTAAFHAGASGYVAKGSAADELAHAIAEVSSGAMYLTPLINRGSLEEVLQQPQQKLLLTPRQREVLQLVAEGHSAKAIGTTLHISSKTVEFHKAEIMKKLKLRSVAALTRYAIDHGMLNRQPTAEASSGAAV